MMQVRRTTGTIGISPRRRRAKTGLIASNTRIERDGPSNDGSLITMSLDQAVEGAKLHIFKHWNASCTASDSRNEAAKPGEEKWTRNSTCCSLFSAPSSPAPPTKPCVNTGENCLSSGRVKPDCRAKPKG